MKRNIIVILILILFSILLITTNTFSQIQFFDSVKIVASSNLYDYKNPVFENENGGYIPSSRIAYERHHDGYSDIIIRTSDFNGYGPETVITDSQNALNINPSLSENILVWQSNVRGNWDLFYSIYLNSSYWSEPRILDSSSSSETNPYINYNNTSSYNYYYLVYKRDNSIRFKKYRTSINAWDLDTNVTLDMNEYITPYLSPGPSFDQYSVIYLKKYSNELTKINVRIFYQPLSPGSISWDNPYEVIQPNSQNNLTIANSHLTFITYSYDTLSSKHLLGFPVNGQNFKEVFTKNIPGRHFIGKGSINTSITDNTFFIFSVFSCLTKSNDSTQLTFINRPSTFNSNPEFKKIYLGDTNVITKFDLSPPVYQSNLYKIKAVWEKQLNGKTALVESYMFDFFSDITNNSQSAEVFNLSQNYPNPFNPSTNIKFEIPKSGNISLKVYNQLGKEVKTLSEGFKNAGSYEINVDANELSSGVYFYKLVTESSSITKKMLLVK